MLAYLYHVSCPMYYDGMGLFKNSITLACTFCQVANPFQAIYLPS